MLVPEDIVDKQNDPTKLWGRDEHYKMRPALNETFKATDIKQKIQEIMNKYLNGKQYIADEVKKWVRDIADDINVAVKNLEQPRYKHVVQVVLGEQLGAGCRYISKCCWDAESDFSVSDVFSNSSLFCVTTVFGVYLY